MKNATIRKSFFLSMTFCAVISPCCACLAKAIPFADNGTLKMLYDNRMYPQAVEYDGSVYIVWRGAKGFPYIISYDLESCEFSKPFMLLTGMEDRIKAKKYKKDHHFAPITWVDNEGYLHTLFGCHVSVGVHLVSTRPGDMTQWKLGSPISDTQSYPKAHRIHDNGTLLYFREGGHLGSWTYCISSDGGKTWVGPKNSVVDLNAEPQDGFLANHAGSYHTTRVSKDGRTLHVAFIWKVEEPVLNRRYNSTLSDHTQRYNLYYLKVDLPSGKAFSQSSKELALPVNKRAADRQCLIWDTQERVAAVGPSIYLDENDQPSFLLAVSEETPHKCRFYFVRFCNNRWVRTAIAHTPHPFNACHLDRSDDGRYKAYLITGEAENISEEEMDRYGWGDRVELWISDREGENWKLSKDLTPVQGYRYQNVQFVLSKARQPARDMILFYGWQDSSADGTAFLWDNRQ